jgi:iron complex outermembrane receptor protein
MGTSDSFPPRRSRARHRLISPDGPADRGRRRDRRHDAEAPDIWVEVVLSVIAGDHVTDPTSWVIARPPEPLGFQSCTILRRKAAEGGEARASYGQQRRLAVAWRRQQERFGGMDIGRAGWAASFVAACALAFGASPVCAADVVFDFPTQDLATALVQLGTKGNVELLFDTAPMAGRQSAPVHGAKSAEAALREMLVGTGFVLRRSRSGNAFVIDRAASSPLPESETRESTAVAELLVVGSRSLNTDIRRSEDDIQPYSIFTSDQIEAAQVQTVEELLQTRDPQDAQAGTLAQAPVANGGAVHSRIDLGGLGAAQTLVLVDGRRLPSIPGTDVFQQGDLNGIPLAAIDRIETLTSTAGGIFGPGATGGVINVILKHDYDSAQFDVEGGITDRGDAPHGRVEGVWGHSFFGGDTQVMLAVSHAEDAGLTQGQRDIAVEARQQLFQNGKFPSPPISASLNLIGFGLPPDGTPFTEVFTHKPLNLPLASGGLAALNSNSGSLDFSLSPDGQGAMQSLLSRTSSSALVLDVRQVVTPRIEVFFDGLFDRNEGWAVGPRTQPSVISLDGGEPGNPLSGEGVISFPTPGLAATSVDRLDTLRLTTGVIAQLTSSWRAAFDVTYGRATDKTHVPAQPNLADASDFDFFNAGALISKLYPAFPPDLVEQQMNSLLDVNLRLSGPSLTLPAGVATMTLLGEFRSEHQPNVFLPFSGDAGALTLISLGPQDQTVGSAYAELKAPLFARDSAFALRGLELQVAARVDRESATAPADNGEFRNQGGGSTPYSGGWTTFAFTTGLRAFPIDGLMLRASVATGYLPPQPSQLIEGVYPASFFPVEDPQRGNTRVGSTTPATLEAVGSPTLQPEHARTISVGFVATPVWASGLRLSLDYTRIDKTHEITEFADFDFAYILAHAAEFPSRVTRAPLTAADIAAGYTAGAVTNIDTSAFNIGRSLVQTVDLDASYRLDIAASHVRLYAHVTWEPDYLRKDNPDNGFYQTAGHLGGPLTVRANGGVDWSVGRWSAGLNVQVYGGYEVTYADPTQTLLAQNLSNVEAQGGKTVPAQAYADFDFAYRQPLHPGPTGLKSIEYRLGVHNVLDTQPPLLLIEANTTQPAQSLYYSPYGDPRGRRFELAVVGTF